MTKVVIVGDMTFGEEGPPSIRPPLRPDQGLPPVSPGAPDQGLPGGPGGSAGQLPVWPIGPDQGLPPIAGQPLPPINPPPGTIWPPLPPSVEPGKTLVYAGIVGVGNRWIVVEVPPHKPDHGLPPEHGRPDQGLPPTAAPKHK